MEGKTKESLSSMQLGHTIGHEYLIIFHSLPQAAVLHQGLGMNIRRESSSLSAETHPINFSSESVARYGVVSQATPFVWLARLGTVSVKFSDLT